MLVEWEQDDVVSLGEQSMVAREDDASNGRGRPVKRNAMPGQTLRLPRRRSNWVVVLGLQRSVFVMLMLAQGSMTETVGFGVATRA